MLYTETVEGSILELLKKLEAENAMAGFSTVKKNIHKQSLKRGIFEKKWDR